jgi:probable HAF family extracellular repeat protein
MKQNATSHLSRRRLNHLFIGLAFTLPAEGFGQACTITDLGEPAWNYSAAHGINQSGNVVGEFATTNAFSTVHAFYFAGGVMTDIGSADGTEVAYGINAANQLVGEMGVAVVRGFVYANGTTTALSALGGNYSSAYAINDAGLIVGESTTSPTPNGPVHALVWDGGSKSDLQTLSGDYSAGFAINNSNVVAGESSVVVVQGVTNIHAFVYTNVTSGMKDLGTLGGAYSSAKGINDSGVIVGEANTMGDTNLHAFSYQDGIMNDLGTLGGSTSSASAVNSSGQIVGYATDSNGVANAFLYNGSKMLNLIDFIPPSSGWTNLASADAINDAGQIAGSGFLANGAYHAYLLTPSVAAIWLSYPLVLTDGQLQVTVEAVPGQRFAMLGSTNLASWVSLNTNTLGGTSILVTNPAAGNCRFYRALLLP